MKYAFVNGYVLSGHEDMQPEEKVIFVDGEKISAIKEKGADTTGYEVVDLNGQYIMPGLINMHVHIPASGKPKKGKTNYNAIAALLKFAVARAVVRKMCANLAKEELLSGTTTIRAVGGVMDFDTKLRNNIESGKTKGPRILAADYAVSVPGAAREACPLGGRCPAPRHSPLRCFFNGMRPGTERGERPTGEKPVGRGKAPGAGCRWHKCPAGAYR